MIGAGECVHELRRHLHACAASDQYLPGDGGRDGGVADALSCVRVKTGLLCFPSFSSWQSGRQGGDREHPRFHLCFHGGLRGRLRGIHDYQGTLGQSQANPNADDGAQVVECDASAPDWRARFLAPLRGLAASVVSVVVLESQMRRITKSEVVKTLVGV